MKVFKFGGASVKDASAIKNLFNIVNAEKEPLVIIVSAMGKSTNALEKLHQLAFQKEDFSSELNVFIQYHNETIVQLFHQELESIKKLFQQLESNLKDCSTFSKEFTYAQIVSYGELISTKIVSEYFSLHSKSNCWLDARKCIQTDSNWLEGEINWSFTKLFVNQFVIAEINKNNIVITQGFIGANSDGHTTTLGREGSDYSAAIFANCLNASSITVWKDVDGILTGDPKIFENVEKFEELSYRETIEMAYYGASVLHPKTIQPLIEKNIPLIVRSFINTSNSGTTIVNDVTHAYKPSFILKENQCLVTFSNKNLSFTDEKSFGEVLTFLSTKNIRVNLIQSAATSFSFCIDYSPEKIDAIVNKLSSKYTILYNTELKLLTIKNYTEQAINQIHIESKKVYLEQKTRNNIRLVYKNLK